MTQHVQSVSGAIAADAPPAAPQLTAASRRSIAGSFFGMVLESYEFLLYASVATVILGPLFFPSSDPFVGAILAAATFAVGFVARPVGGMIFGHFGDRLGRKPLMLLSLMLIGISTVGVGLLPTYAQIGLAAPIILVLLRILQGIAYGGELGGAVLMSVEHAPRKMRGLVGALPMAAVPLGLLLATGMLKLASAATGPAYMTWGWRIPFLFAVVVLALGMWVRRQTTETPVFEAAEKNGERPRQPLMQAILNYPREIVYSAGVFALAQCVYYTVIVFAVDYCVVTLKIPFVDMMTSVAIASAVQIFALIGFGALSDRLGRVPVMLFGALALVVLMTQIFGLLQTRDLVTITLVLTLALVLNSAFYGPSAALIAESFGPEVRFSGISLGANLGTLLGGAFTPMIALSLLRSSNNQTWPVAVYVVSVIAIGIISLLLLTRAVSARPR
ncbi:MFS transporter [Bordetella genomosp. 12]|nr:MFS transporter [Bordetella genomosp. 12]